MIFNSLRKLRSGLRSCREPMARSVLQFPSSCLRRCNTPSLSKAYYEIFFYYFINQKRREEGVAFIGEALRLQVFSAAAQTESAAVWARAQGWGPPAAAAAASSNSSGPNFLFIVFTLYHLQNISRFGSADILCVR